MTEFCDATASGLLSVALAQQQIRNSLQAVEGIEYISLSSALGRVLAEAVCAKVNLPGDTNASMDGYACHSRDSRDDSPWTLHCCGTSWAGKPYQNSLQPGQCVRIFTGAVVPDGADTVVIQESVERRGDQVMFSTPLSAGDNIRRAGEDIEQGRLLLDQGKKISAIDMGLLAAAGVYRLPVVRRLRIGFLSTGDELRGIGQSLAPGQLYDSNRYTLAGLLSDPSFTVTDLGRCGDDKDALQQILANAANDFDVLITTGGASVGEADYIKAILDDIGRVNFWKIAMKPGKPLAFGRINQTWFFGLPGNPVSVIATFHQMVAPALQQLSGVNARQPLRLKVRCSSGLKKTPGRQEFQRGLLKLSADGEMTVESAGKQGSHILSATSRANCYIILPADCHGVAIDDLVLVEPFDRML